MVSTGDDLLRSQRTLIERSFECRLYNRYGLREISGYIAQECRAQRGLHINVEHVMLEIVDRGGVVVQGKPGRIIITDLHNRVMPLIRYDTGDMGILSTNPCTCGITWPILQVIQGRQRDYVALKDGTQIHLGIIADSFLRHFSGKILHVQFVERGQGFMTVRVIPQERLTHTDMTRVGAYLSKLFSSFDVKFTYDLPSDISGKTPLLVREDREGS
jgi:phenylacetate-CoA ligase